MVSIDDVERDAIIAWARARGFKGTSLRDATHEISHAVTVHLAIGQRLNLARREIHAGLWLSVDRAGAFTDECLARAVERLACDLAGSLCGDLSGNSRLEGALYGVDATLEKWQAGIEAQAAAAGERLAEIRRLVRTPRARVRRTRKAR